MISRAVIGLFVAMLVALLARRTRSLSASGAAAATIVGGIAVAAGWSWGALLIVYFIATTLLSRAGRAEKERRTASIVAKGGERDAVQVLANGLVFAFAAAGQIAASHPRWIALGIGALAASAADTWATEIGTLFGGTPRSILDGRRVPAGTSGGISVAGTLAGVAGACFIAIAGCLLGFDGTLARFTALGGFAGALVDSLLGATMQARRWCDSCSLETERSTHDCGMATRPLRGIGWLDNDVVNFVSSAAGGLLAASLVR